MQVAQKINKLYIQGITFTKKSLNSKYTDINGVVVDNSVTFLVIHYYSNASEVNAQSNINPLENVLSRSFGNITNTFNQLAKEHEYTILEGNQIFPNSTLKENIVDKYHASTYHIMDLKYNLLGFNVTAHDIKIHVNPARIDARNTRANIPVMIAFNVSITNGIIHLNYGQVDLGSLFGIYDKATDRMMVHIPFAVASKYLHLYIDHQHKLTL